MPKSNESFWTKKFSENVERDARTVEALSQEGWQVLIVWECELVKRTIETVEKVANAIRNNLHPPSPPQYRELDLERKELLTVAEEKVRYRINKKT